MHTGPNPSTAMSTAADPRSGSAGSQAGASTDGAPRRLRRRSLTRAVCAAIVAASAGLLTFTVSDAGAATPLTDYSTNFTRVEGPNPQEGAGWARRLRTVPDLNGDGRMRFSSRPTRNPSVAFRSPVAFTCRTAPRAGYLYMIDSPQIQSNVEFGFFPAVVGDINGEGKADFVGGRKADRGTRRRPGGSARAPGLAQRWDAPSTAATAADLA